MNIKRHVLFLALACLAGINQSFSQGTVFTYQGRLNDSGQPANGSNYGMVFYLYDAPVNGNPLGNLGISSVTVSNGLFTVPLNFGNVFDGNQRWLEIAVQKNGGTFTTLAPRQPITPTPYAMFANTASNLSGTVNSAGLSGAYGNAVNFNNANNNFSGSFTGNHTGDGFNLVNLNPQSISPGTVSSLLVLENPNNNINGSFIGNYTGDGFNLVNLNPQSISPGTVSSLLVLENPNNNINGSFIGNYTGDGANLINLSANNVTGGLTTNIARVGTGRIDENSLFYQWYFKSCKVKYFV